MAAVTRAWERALEDARDVRGVEWSGETTRDGGAHLHHHHHLHPQPTLGVAGASRGKRSRACYVEAIGVLDRRWAKKRHAGSGARRSADATPATSATTSASAASTDMDVDADGASSPARARREYVPIVCERAFGVARALAFDDAGRGTFPLDPSSTF